jgi:hypothetical protein
VSLSSTYCGKLKTQQLSTHLRHEALRKNGFDGFPSSLWQRVMLGWATDSRHKSVQVSQHLAAIDSSDG